MTSPPGMNLTHPDSPDVKAALETKCCVLAGIEHEGFEP